MKQISTYIIALGISLQLLGCSQDPLLKPVDQTDDNYSYRDITVTNNSDHAVGVCEYYECDFGIPAGQTTTVAVRYFHYNKSETPESVSISIKTASQRRIALLESMSWTRFLTEGREIRWLGNFSGPHSFVVTAELAALAANLISDHNDYNRDGAEELKFPKALNQLDRSMTIRSQIYQELVVLTLPEGDSEIYWGEAETSEPDGTTGDRGIVVSGWRYIKVKHELNNTLFSAYTASVSFTCTNGGCFPEL